STSSPRSSRASRRPACSASTWPAAAWTTRPPTRSRSPTSARSWTRPSSRSSTARSRSPRNRSAPGGRLRPRTGRPGRGGSGEPRSRRAPHHYQDFDGSTMSKEQAAGEGTPPAVELRGITKRFPGVVANHDIDITVGAGTVHAIVGENGAGKSTLMKTLYGLHRPDEGEILIDGRRTVLNSPAGAIRHGVGMVHQHFMLADNLTVLENTVLGAEARHGIGAGARARVRELSDQYGLNVRPDVLVEELGVGDRQRVEILKVLYRGARIVILDEPTAVLVPQEVDELFANLRELKREGLTVIFISHKLDEVLRVADTITVIRRGTTVGTVDPAATTARELASLMVGGTLPVPELRESTVTDETVLELDGLRVEAADGRPVVDGVSLRIRRGEIVGIAGVE